MIIERAPVHVTHEKAQEQYRRYCTLTAPLEKLWHTKEMRYIYDKPMTFKNFMDCSQMVITEASL